MTARTPRCFFAPGAGPQDVIGDHYVALDGSTSTFVSTPDDASLDVTGDIDIRVDARMPSWQPPGETPASGVLALGLGQVLIGKWTASSDQRSWVLCAPAGDLFFYWTTAGTEASINGVIGSGATDILTPGRRLILRVTLDVDNGAGANVVTFYYSDPLLGGTIDSGPWTTIQSGSGITSSAPTSIFAGTSTLRVGWASDGVARAAELVGHGYRAQVRNGIGGTVVANPDFAGQPNGNASFADSAGRTWNFFGNAAVAGFDWVDVSDDLLAASWKHGRSNEFDHHPAGDAEVRLKNDDRVYDPDHTTGIYAGLLLPRTPFRLDSVASALTLPGTTGATASTPDHASLALTDLDLRVHLAADDWTPGGFGKIIASQWGAAGNESWLLGLTASGQLQFSFTTDGSTDQNRTSTNPLGFVDGSDHWLRATLDADNGAAQHVVTLYTGTDGTDWTVLQTFTTAGTVAVFNSTANLVVGDTAGGGLAFDGRIRYLELRSTISGTVVAAPDFMAQRTATTSFRDGCGKTWTVNGSAAVAIDTATPFDEFYGFVSGPWTQDVQPPEYADCVLRLTDRLEPLGGIRLPDVFDAAILDRDPAGYWVLDSASSAEQIADRAGSTDGTVVGDVQLGQRPVVSGHRQSAEIEPAAVGEPRSFIEVTSGSQIVTDPTRSAVMATCIARSAAVSGKRRVLFIHDRGNSEPTSTLRVDVDDQGRLNVVATLNGGGNANQWPTSIVDGDGHVVFADAFGIAVDTAVLDQNFVSGFGILSNGVGIGGHNGVDAAEQWDGWIAAVALWGRRTGEGERSLILDGYGLLAGLRSDQHIAWALDAIGVYPEHRTLDQGSVLMGPAAADGQDALEWCRAVAATEQGEWRVDHHDAGRLRFVERYSRFTEARSTTPQVTFSDDPNATEPVVRVERGQLDIVPNSAEFVINEANVSWRDGTETVVDEPSRDALGPKPRNVTTEATTAAQARAVGEWLIARFKDPRSMVRGVGISPAAAKAGWRAVQHLRIGDRVRVRYHPQQVGAATTVDCFVEGISHASAGVEWTTHYDLSPVDTFTPAQWDVSTWDVTAFWG